MSPNLDDLKDQLIVGIDLGTTNSGLAVWCNKSNQVIMLPNIERELLTPSIVGWDDTKKECLVGNKASILSQEFPSRVAYSIKRYIGRSFQEINVIPHQLNLTYNLVARDGQDPLEDFWVKFDDDCVLSAPEVSAKVLAKLRQDAAEALQLPIETLKYAVITVPAYFNANQRKATIRAGEKAGWEVVDILDEPTAAILAYQDAIPLGCEDRKILVYDLGGGTFDISLLEVTHDDNGYAINTRILDGDTCLGGDDIDINLANYLAKKIQDQYDTKINFSDGIIRKYLRQQAERAKIRLSQEESITISFQIPINNYPSYEPYDLSVQIDQSELEELAKELLRRTREILKRAIEDVAQISWQEIDEVILVGGQTLMPLIHKDIEELTGHKPRVNDRPQLAVAIGAGEYAHILSLGKANFHKNALSNVIALPLGIRLDQNTFQEMVPANVTIPYISNKFTVTTIKDNQTTICVELLQGKHQQVTNANKDCVVLGSINMEVPPSPARSLKFEVTFYVESNALIQVSVYDPITDRTEKLDIYERKVLVWRDCSHHSVQQ